MGPPLDQNREIFPNRLRDGEKPDFAAIGNAGLYWELSGGMRGEGR
jgi:hypothetical protein